MKGSLCIVLVAGVAISSASPEEEAVKPDAVSVLLQANKDVYRFGEPVLLRTVMSNFAPRPFRAVRKGFGIGWPAGLTWRIAREKGEFVRIDSIEGKQTFAVSTAPRQFDFFTDHRWLPGALGAGDRAARVDMLIIPKAGEYRLQAEAIDRNGSGWLSPVITVTVQGGEAGGKGDANARDQRFAVNLGSTIFYVHYDGRILGGYPPGESLDAKQFAKAATPILAKDTSPFREYVLYAKAVTSRTNMGLWLDEKGAKLARDFVRQYPKSWLLPDVYRLLFLTAVGEKRYKEAASLREKALKAGPWATVLRDVRQRDLKAFLVQEKDRGKAPARKDPAAGSGAQYMIPCHGVRIHIVSATGRSQNTSMGVR